MKRRGFTRKIDDEDYVIYTETHRRRRATKKNITAGPWTIKENQIYLSFLQIHRQLFQTQFIRRSSKVFRKMSSLLRRRDPQQCRSHHQKLVIKCQGKIQNIIDRLQKKISMAKEKLRIKNMEEKVAKEKQVILRTGDRSEKFIEKVNISQECENSIKITIDLDYLTVW